MRRAPAAGNDLHTRDACFNDFNVAQGTLCKAVYHVDTMQFKAKTSASRQDPRAVSDLESTSTWCMTHSRPYSLLPGINSVHEDALNGSRRKMFVVSNICETSANEAPSRGGVFVGCLVLKRCEKSVPYAHNYELLTRPQRPTCLCETLPAQELHAGTFGVHAPRRIVACLSRKVMCVGDTHQLRSAVINRTTDTQREGHVAEVSRNGMPT